MGFIYFHEILVHAFKAGASGFLAGRAIWQDAFSAYPDWDQVVEGLAGGSLGYLEEIVKLADASAHAWHRHSCYGPDGAVFNPADARFRFGYDAM